jgi:hypothetical protein
MKIHICPICGFKSKAAPNKKWCSVCSMKIDEERERVRESSTWPKKFTIKEAK